MGVRGISHFDQQADAEPRIARPGLPQAVGTAPPSRPGHRGADGVQKNFAASLDRIAERDAAGKPIEIWFQDEARIGQKNKITRRWARRGTRPSAPHDQRTRSAYIFGSSARSARPTGAPPALSCRAAIPPQWRCIWRKSQKP